jgi:3-hydroxyacyl-[acyl-carrier-protein] dehydratase
MHNDILKCLPYKSSFLFVDNILSINEDGVTGEYTLRKNAFFFEDHFPGNPVTPGVIITEIMAQIGLVVLGIHLMNGGIHEEKVTVTSKKQYFRFGKLKCLIEMHNASAELIAKGVFSGIIKSAAIKDRSS